MHKKLGLAELCFTNTVSISNTGQESQTAAGQKERKCAYTEKTPGEST